MWVVFKYKKGSASCSSSKIVYEEKEADEKVKEKGEE